MSGRPDGRGADSSVGGHDEPVGRRSLAATLGRRLDALEADGRIRGYAPLVDHDALDARTVLVRLAVSRPDVPAVAAWLRDAGALSVFELTGSENLLAVCRFTTGTAREAFLARLATDDRVHRVGANDALRTVVEGDQRDLL
ncbi:Lrp/AsnC family transcriptional regulator [Halorarius litoreus]|uniref:Lrp/AsnC family transcriptional regulator n=1 Tax=Halorarius litoreus TaxID=2962676 RepID=UPI0020CBEC56|nr:Lrp/AsnC family transcriptional regulator [Halorarius litoreus]